MTDIITYEDLKNILSLSPENEFQDRIFLHYCCNLVTSLMEEQNLDITDENHLQIQAIIIRVFKYKLSQSRMTSESPYSNLTDKESMELLCAVKDTIAVAF